MDLTGRKFGTASANRQADLTHFRILDIASSHLTRVKRLARYFWHWNFSATRAAELRAQSLGLADRQAKYRWLSNWKILAASQHWIRVIILSSATRYKKRVLCDAFTSIQAHVECSSHRKGKFTCSMVKTSCSTVLYKIINSWVAATIRNRTKRICWSRLAAKHTIIIKLKVLNNFFTFARRRKRVRAATLACAQRTALSSWMWSLEMQRKFLRQDQRAATRARRIELKHIASALGAWTRTVQASRIEKRALMRDMMDSRRSLCAWATANWARAPARAAALRSRAALAVHFGRAEREAARSVIGAWSWRVERARRRARGCVRRRRAAATQTILAWRRAAAAARGTARVIRRCGAGRTRRAACRALDAWAVAAGRAPREAAVARRIL